MIFSLPEGSTRENMVHISLPLATISTNQVTVSHIVLTERYHPTNQSHALFHFTETIMITVALHRHTAAVLHTRQTLFTQIQEENTLIDTKQEAISYPSISPRGILSRSCTKLPS